MVLSHCWCLYLAVLKFLFLFWNVILYEFLHSESSPLLHILIDAFPLPQVIFILKLFIDGCTLGAKSYCTNQFLADILISGTLVVTGVKKPPPIETKSKCIILPCCGISHLSASVVRIVRAGENPDLFPVRWNLICLYHFHEVLVTPTATLSNG